MRPSDRKSATITIRLTKAERAALNKERQPSESLSDVARRLLFRGVAGQSDTETGA